MFLVKNMLKGLTHAHLERQLSTKFLRNTVPQNSFHTINNLIGQTSSIMPIFQLNPTQFGGMMTTSNSFAFSTLSHQKRQVPFRSWKIVRGDQVVMISGQDQGKQGTILKVYRKSNMVKISGINVKLKRGKTDLENDLKGGIRQQLNLVHVSKVSLIDPELGKPTRIRFGYLADGQKVRIAKKSGSIIQQPVLPELSFKERIQEQMDGLKDTGSQKVLEVTYKGENFDQIKREFEEFIRKKEEKEKNLVFQE